MLTFVKYTDAPEPPSARTFFEKVGETKSTSTGSYSNTDTTASTWSSGSGSLLSTNAVHSFVSSSEKTTNVGTSSFTESTAHWETRVTNCSTDCGANGPVDGFINEVRGTTIVSDTTVSRYLSRSSQASTLGTRFTLRTTMTYATASTTSRCAEVSLRWDTINSDTTTVATGTSIESGTSLGVYGGTHSTYRTFELSTSGARGALVRTVVGGSYYRSTVLESRKETMVGAYEVKSTRSVSYSWTAPICRDGGTTTATSQAFGTIVTSTLASTTMATVSGSVSSSTEATYTRHTTATGYQTYTASMTTTTKAWTAASNSPLSWASRSFQVIVVLDTDRVLALRSNGWEVVPPGTYDRRELPLGLIGAEAQLVTTNGNQYSERPATTEGYFDYTTVTITRRAIIDTTYVQAIPGSVLPIDSLETVTAPSSVATVSFTTYGSNSVPTYTYSGHPSGDRRDSLGGFTSVSTSNATIWNADGSTSWGSAYSGSSSASPLRWLNSSSYEYETQSDSGETTNAASTNRTAKTYSVRGYYVSTGATGQDYSVTTTSRFSADLNSWWTYTYVEEGMSERNMLLAATPCEIGFVPYPGMPAGSNISLVPAANPPSLNGSIYGSTVRGGALCPAFFGSAAVPSATSTYTSSVSATSSTTEFETTASVTTSLGTTLTTTLGAYNTTYLGSNSYRYGYGNPETTGIAELLRAGVARSIDSVAPFSDYAPGMPPTVVGGAGHETTVSLFLQRYSWYSFFAVAYSSLNLTDSEAAVTRGTWNCVPWIPESSATTMRVSSDAQVVFRVVPNVTTGTRKEIGATTAIPTDTVLGWVTTATYDPWV